MRKGVGRYVATGMGGGATTARRLGGTATTAGLLYRTLTADQAQSQLDRDLLQGKSARKVINAVIELACPTNGTLDTEASRFAINDALSLVLERFPDADLLALTDEQRVYAVQQYVSFDVYRHFMLDLGKTIQDRAPSASTGQRRLREVQNYIRETVVSQFDRLKQLGKTLGRKTIVPLVKSVLRAACDVFEEYAD